MTAELAITFVRILCKRIHALTRNYCAWSKSCTSSGPWLALIDGDWHECMDPEDADLPLYCVAHSRQFDRLRLASDSDRESARQVSGRGRTSRRSTALRDSTHHTASAFHLFPLRMIHTATADAQEVMERGATAGEPTWDALLARQWIEHQPDWNDAEDWYGSFEWCCHWLSIDVQEQRKRSIEEIDDSLARKFLRFRRNQLLGRQLEVLQNARPLVTRKSTQQMGFGW